MGQLSDPYNQGEDDGEMNITLSGLPEDDDLPEEADEDSPQDAVTEVDGEDIDEDNDLDDDEEDIDDEESSEDDIEVGYDLSEWGDKKVGILFDVLDDEEIPYLWDGEELFINEEDEPAVDKLIERVESGGVTDVEDEGDSDGGGWILGDLFVVADRLQRDPEEHDSNATLLQLADKADEMDAPYGLSEAEWEQLREKVTAVATILEADKPDFDAAIEAAQELRSATRPYV